jgi:diaminopimelate epimerase
VFGMTAAGAPGGAPATATVGGAGAAGRSGPPPAIAFAKYQGAGNDFVVLDGRRQAFGVAAWPGGEVDWPALARAMCHRHFGVGADGLLVAGEPVASEATMRMRMFNPDGSEAEMCGNGLRCFVRWLADRREISTGRLAVETGAGVLAVQVEASGLIAVEMGTPRLRPADIPLSPAATAGQLPAGPVLHLPLTLAPLPGQPGTPGLTYEATCVSMGNPHAVVFVDDPAAVPLEVVGPRLERHPAFPARANVEFCRVLANDRMRVRVWERGAGMTLACGTGACAAVVAAHLRGYVGDRVAVELPGGELEVTWAGPGSGPVVLRGPAEHVFDGRWPCA